MFSISCPRVCRPLIRAVELFNEPLGQQPLEVAHKDDVVLAMKINPTFVAVLGILALRLTGRCAVKNLVERLLMDIPQHHVEILAERNVPVAMHHKAIHDALAAQAKMSVAPFIIECHEVVVLLSVVNALRNLLHEVRCCQQFEAIVP